MNKALNFNSFDRTKQLNYLFILFAFSFPLSKALTNFVEILAIIIWISQGDFRNRLVLFKSNLLIMSYFLFVIISAVSVLFYNDLGDAWDYIAKYRHFWMILIFYTALDKKYIQYIFSAFLISVLISELMSYGIYFQLFTYKDATPQLPTPFLHHITYSIILSFASVILLSRVFSEDKAWIRLLELIFFFTVVTNLYMNGGRTGQLAFTVLILIFFISYFEKKLRAMFLSLSSIIIIISLAYNLSPNFKSRVHQLEQGFSKAFYEKDYTDQGGMRLSMIIVGTKIFLDNPIFGVGIGNQMRDANTYAQAANLNTRDMNTFADYHNIFINISVQLGLVGLLSLLCMFYALYTLEIKTKQYRILLKLFVVAFFIFSLTHNTIHLMNSLVFLSLFSGLFNAIARLECTKNT